MNDQTPASVPTTVPATLPATPLSPRLVASLEDAEILRQHAARNGVAIELAITKTIIDMRAAVSAGSVGGGLEAEFWDALTELSKKLQPATVEGIKETRQFRGSFFAAWFTEKRLTWPWWGKGKGKAAPTQEHPPEAYVAVGRYTLLAIVMLVAVVMTQILSGYGVMALGNLKSLQEQRTARQTEIAELQKLPTTEPTRQSQIDAADRAFDDIRTQEAANVQLLRVFNYLSTPWFGSLPDAVNPGDDAVLVAVRARISIAALNGYLMPLLIGTLGAIAHILRTLAMQISQDSYSSEARVQLRLRLVLGPLAGAAVGLIFVQDPQALADGKLDTVAQLGLGVGPFALPFVAGYSVEFFFALADRVIGAFTAKATPEGN